MDSNLLLEIYLFLLYIKHYFYNILNYFDILNQYFQNQRKIKNKIQKMKFQLQENNLKKAYKLYMLIFITAYLIFIGIGICYLIV